MEPIINPWLIYFFSLSESLSIFLVGSAIVISLAGAFAMFVWWNERDEPEDRMKQKKAASWGIAVVLTAFLFGAILPDKNTLFQMLVASKLTPDNYQALKAEGKDALKFLIDESLKDLKAEKK